MYVLNIIEYTIQQFMNNENSQTKIYFQFWFSVEELKIYNYFIFQSKAF